MTNIIIQYGTFLEHKFVNIYKTIIFKQLKSLYAVDYSMTELITRIYDNNRIVRFKVKMNIILMN